MRDDATKADRVRVPVEERPGIFLHPTDLILSRDGIAIEGGPHSGSERTWPEVWAGRLELQRGKHGDELVLLDAGEPMSIMRGRRDSLQALEQSLSSAGWSVGEFHRGVAPYVLTCPRCATPVPTRDQDEVVCVQCGQSVILSREVRERVEQVRAERQKRAEEDRMVAALVTQAGARRVRAQLLVWSGATFAVLLSLILLIGRPDISAQRKALVDLVAIGLWVASIQSACYFIYTRRSALRELALSFGARDPSVKDGPYSCRECGGPLVKQDVVARCIYCSTENVLGLDLRQLTAVTTDAVSLDETLMQCDRAHIRFAIGTVLAWVLAICVLLVGLR